MEGDSSVTEIKAMELLVEAVYVSVDELILNEH